MLGRPASYGVTGTELTDLLEREGLLLCQPFPVMEAPTEVATIMPRR